jgi:predicted Rossmann-fold nucleotide-binding protein
MPPSESGTSLPSSNDLEKTAIMTSGGESTTANNGAPTTAVATANGHDADGKKPKTKFAVYCGASPGHRPEHLAMARELARAMHTHDVGLGMYSHQLACFFSSFASPLFLFVRENCLFANWFKIVYGGGTGGMMGELAKTLVELSGPDAVHGVIP